MKGNVYAVLNSGEKATKVIIVAKGLDKPVGVDFRDGSLYVSAVDRIEQWGSLIGSGRGGRRPQ